MQVDIRGRVSNISLRSDNCLLPLFEGIINSIDAIDAHEAGAALDPLIRVTVIRDRPDQFFAGPGYEHNPIIGFSVADNGIGFTHVNYDSFQTSDSRLKAPRGGKGVGRFLWLKAFERVKVDSVFAEGSNLYRRRFEFSLDDPYIHNHHCEPALQAGQSTVVELRGYLQPYNKCDNFRAETIARRIVEHLLEYFVLETMPPAILIDEGRKIDLHDVYRDWVNSSKRTTFTIAQQEFSITHFLLHARSTMEHGLSYCGNHRVVNIKPISYRVIPNIVPRLSDNADRSGNLVYAGYVSGQYLDSHINQTRTGFDIPTNGTFLFADDVTWEQIEAAALEESRTFLQGYTEPIAKKKREQIEAFIQQHAPEFRPLLKHHADKLDRIPPELPEDKLAVELYLIKREVEAALKGQARELIAGVDLGEPGQTRAEIKARLSRFLEEWNDVGKAELAQYIIHRRATLELLRKSLGRQPSGKYSLEDAIHKMIFPMKTTSDNIDYEDHNLWIIDERLAYHYYLASDLALSRVEAADSDSNLRPDLLIFTGPIAVVEGDHPYSSIVIVEFKRPMRDDYKPGENPIVQVYDYVRDLTSGKAKNKAGRIVTVNPNTRFYAYIICDITTTLEQQADNANLYRTPDGEGLID